MTLKTQTQPYTVRCEVNEALESYITERLREYNRLHEPAATGQPAQPRLPLQVYIRDEQGVVIGGLAGRTNEIAGWLQISVLWVAEAVRGEGLGSHLMAVAEAEAKQRGCRYARLATSDYQAPNFYRKLGYQLYGQLEDCPAGETVYYFYKELV